MIFFFFSEWHRHSRKKKFRVLPTGVEPTTFRLLVRHCSELFRLYKIGADPNLIPLQNRNKFHLPMRWSLTIESSSASGTMTANDPTQPPAATRILSCKTSHRKQTTSATHDISAPSYHCQGLSPLISTIKYQILLFCPHTSLHTYWGDVIKVSRKFTLGDHILNSHDLRDWISIDTTRRNLMLITVRA